MNNLIQTPQVIGYKIWELGPDWSIFSCNGKVEEDQPAMCHYGRFALKPEEHKSPEINCSCGYYYTSSKEQLLHYWSGEFRGKAAFELSLYGKIIECELGGRAEYFKVLRIFLTPKMLEEMIMPARYPYVVLEEAPKPKLKAKSATEWIKHYQSQQIKEITGTFGIKEIK